MFTLQIHTSDCDDVAVIATLAEVVVKGDEASIVHVRASLNHVSWFFERLDDWTHAMVAENQFDDKEREEYLIKLEYIKSISDNLTRTISHSNAMGEN